MTKLVVCLTEQDVGNVIWREPPSGLRARTMTAEEEAWLPLRRT
jgi:hypothetical protein